MPKCTKVQMHVSQLKLGMFICELDRPWLDTPFYFQGFRLQRIEELDKLRNYCETVFVDTEKSITLRAAKTEAETSPFNKPTQGRVYTMSASLEEEIATASEIRVNTRNTVAQVFDDIAHGRKFDVQGVKNLVDDMVDGVLRNPDAHLCLTQLKKRDEYTAQHSINVSVLALALGRHIGLSRHQLVVLGIGALLHDVGKIKTPLDVLNKPGKLTDEEFALMKEHPAHGRKILERFDDLPYDVLDMAFGHHERIAGTGYPRGLSSDEISFWSRLVSIVDVYDAITSDRCYHKGMSPTEALTKMYSWRTNDFDPELLEQFIQCVGIYPVGTLVELTSGEVGVVTHVNKELRLRPRVQLVLNADKQPCNPVRTVDLAAISRDDPMTSYGIRQVLNPGSYNINAREQLCGQNQACLRMAGMAV